MYNTVNLDDIRKIPQEEFKDILHSWMNQKELAKTLQKKLRKQLVEDFQVIYQLKKERSRVFLLYHQMKSEA